MVQNIARARLHPWLFVHVGFEPDLHMEVPEHGHGRDAVGPHRACPLPRDEPRRADNRNRRRGRNAPVLERVSEEEGREGREGCHWLGDDDPIVAKVLSALPLPLPPSFPRAVA